MKITRISQQVKRQDRYSIYIDDEYTFSLSESDLVRLGLRKGQEFTADKLEDMQRVSSIGKAYDKALNYLSIRPRSEYEIRQYLRRKHYDAEAVEEVVKKLHNLKLIDDMAFARLWVESRQAIKPRSRRKLHQELMQKGVDRDVINQALEVIDEDVQLQNLQKLIEKKRSRYDDERKLMAYLAGQGYSYDLIKRALCQEK